MKVLVAMSGGVDSSVAAALMVDEGHEVVGATLKLWQGPNGEAPTAGCCTVADAEDARRVAAALDIPYYVLDYTDDFEAGVVNRFLGEYRAGRTPNPCIECNRTVKFSRLMDQAAQLGCGAVVTGHYARIRRAGGRWRLLRGIDRDKDQSYVLSMLTQAQLARVRFPVGELTKAETRGMAASLGLRTAHKPDSQDICFVGSGDYRAFLRRLDPAAARSGPIVDRSGGTVGAHRGVVDFTVGQRRGLGVAVGEPRYVVELRPSSATVVVGSREDLAVAGFELASVSWVAGRPPADSRLEVQVRAHGATTPAVLTELDPVVVRLPEPVEAVAPGQTATFYRDEEVLGGGVIARTMR